MTQEVLAAAAGVSAQTVRRAEAGRPLSAETVQGLCAALGIEASSLLTPAGLPPSTVAAIGAHASPSRDTASPSSDTCPIDVTVAGPKASPPSRVRRSTWVMTAFLVVAVVFQTVTWGGAVIDGQDWFCEFEAVSLTALAIAGAIVAVRRAPARREGWRRRRAWLMATVASCAVLAPACGFVATSSATVDDVIQGLQDYVRVYRVVEIRAIMEPGWDGAEARWKAQRLRRQFLGVRSPRLETPGTYEAFEARRPACRQLFLHASTYPRDQCEYENERVLDTRVAAFWKSLSGGSVVVHRSDDLTVDDVIGGEGFAVARQMFDAHRWSREVEVDTWWHRFAVTESGFDWKPIETEARAYAAARRDRMGLGN